MAADEPALSALAPPASSPLPSRSPSAAAAREPTPLTDPHGYLALFKFNRKLPRCPRTLSPVSYADIGDPDGTPVLFVPPSGCSRWFAAPQAGHNIRLIVVDRPGTGATPMVPLAERIETSCHHIVSVLEHLNLKPAHVLATSAGIYVALRLLSAHSSIFRTGLAPPPAVFLVSPWSPPLPATDPLAYRQLLDWIPSGLLTTQDTTIPYVFSAVRSAEEAYGVTSKVVGGAVTAMKSWLGGMGVSAPASPAPSIREVSDDEAGRHGAAGPGAGDGGTDVSPVAPESIDTEGGETRRRLWAPSAKYLTTEYLYAEDFRGIGQEHMLCLNRGEIDTGPAWFTEEISAVAAAVRKAQGKDGEKGRVDKLPLDIWWGGQDGMVPRNGQEWLNKCFAAHPGEIAFGAHFVDDGDHSDLIMRAQGVGELYLMIMAGAHHGG